MKLTYTLILLFIVTSLCSQSDDFIGIRIGPNYTLGSDNRFSDENTNRIDYLSMLVYEYNMYDYGINFEFGHNKRSYEDIIQDDYNRYVTSIIKVQTLDLAVKYQWALPYENRFYSRTLLGVKFSTPIKANLNQTSRVQFAPGALAENEDIKPNLKKMDRAFVAGLEFGYGLSKDFTFFTELGFHVSFSTLIKNEITSVVSINDKRFTNFYFVAGIKRPLFI